MLRRAVGRGRLHVSLLLARSNRNHDLVRRKRRECVANREADIRLTRRRIDCLARQLLGRTFGDPLSMTERFLVVGEPVEGALPYNRHHDLDAFCVAKMPTQDVVGMFDGAVDKDVSPHDRNVARPGDLDSGVIDGPRRLIRASKNLARDGRIPKLLRGLAAFGVLPLPGPVDEIALLIVGLLMWVVFYRDRVREAWRGAANPDVAKTA